MVLRTTLVLGIAIAYFNMAVVLTFADTTSSLEVKVGLLLTSGRCCDFLSYEDKASSLNIAIDNLQRDGVLDNETVSFK